MDTLTLSTCFSYILFFTYLGAGSIEGMTITSLSMQSYLSCKRIRQRETLDDVEYVSPRIIVFSDRLTEALCQTNCSINDLIACSWGWSGEHSFIVPADHWHPLNLIAASVIFLIRCQVASYSVRVSSKAETQRSSRRPLPLACCTRCANRAEKHSAPAR